MGGGGGGGDRTARNVSAIECVWEVKNKFNIGKIGGGGGDTYSKGPAPQFLHLC